VDFVMALLRQLAARPDAHDNCLRIEIGAGDAWHVEVDRCFRSFRGKPVDPPPTRPRFPRGVTRSTTTAW
jgi:hypothetical protein